MKLTYKDVHERLNHKLRELAKGKGHWGLLEFFDADEFDYPAQMDKEFLIYLDCVRWEATRLLVMQYETQSLALTVTSDYRPNDPRAHGMNPCRAVDLRCWTNQVRYLIVRAALTVGFTRIGVRYLEDPNDHAKGHIHLDLADHVDPERWPQYRIW